MAEDKKAEYTDMVKEITGGEENGLDLAGIEEDAAEAERVTEKARQEEDRESYTHTFRKPFAWRGKTYKSLTFDWGSLSGKDYLAIEDEIVLKGRTLVSPAFTGDFLAGAAAMACTERDSKGRPVIDKQAVAGMPIRDFQTITRKARDFLLRVG